MDRRAPSPPGPERPRDAGRSQPCDRPPAGLSPALGRGSPAGGWLAAGDGARPPGAGRAKRGGGAGRAGGLWGRGQGRGRGHKPASAPPHPRRRALASRTQLPRQAVVAPTALLRPPLPAPRPVARAQSLPPPAACGGGLGAGTRSGEAELVTRTAKETEVGCCGVQRDGVTRVITRVIAHSSRRTMDSETILAQL